MRVRDYTQNQKPRSQGNSKIKQLSLNVFYLGVMVGMTPLSRLLPDKSIDT
jgi:hypothetical protein